MTALTDADREALYPIVRKSVGAYAVVEALIARHVQAALTDAADDLRTNAARAWGGDLNWFTTGAHAANLAAEWVESA